MRDEFEGTQIEISDVDLKPLANKRPSVGMQSTAFLLVGKTIVPGKIQAFTRQTIQDLEFYRKILKQNSSSTLGPNQLIVKNLDTESILGMVKKLEARRSLYNSALENCKNTNCGLMIENKPCPHVSILMK